MTICALIHNALFLIDSYLMNFLFPDKLAQRRCGCLMARNACGNVRFAGK